MIETSDDLNKMMKMIRAESDNKSYKVAKTVANSNSMEWQWKKQEMKTFRLTLSTLTCNTLQVHIKTPLLAAHNYKCTFDMCNFVY